MLGSLIFFYINAPFYLMIEKIEGKSSSEALSQLYEPKSFRMYYLEGKFCIVKRALLLSARYH